jgi:hypothetical protein
VSVKWKSRFEPDVVLQQISNLVAKDKDGHISFSDFVYLQVFKPILIQGIDFPSDVHHHSFDSIVTTALHRSLNQAKADVSISSTKFLAHLKGIIGAHVKLPKVLYHVETTISYKPPLKNAIVSSLGQKIVIAPKKYEGYRGTSIEQLVRRRVKDLPAQGEQVEVRVAATGRSPLEAGRVGLEALEFILGVWNFWALYRRQNYSFSPKTTPIAEIVMGPVRTVHNASGGLATENYFIQPTYVSTKSVSSATCKIDQIRKMEKRIIRRLRGRATKDHLCEAFIRYYNALSEPRLDVAHLQLWALLEFLTGTTKANADVTMRRSKFLLSEQNFTQQELHWLCSIRNQFAHQLDSPRMDFGLYEGSCFALKKYIDTLLMFMLFRVDKNMSIDDIWTLLDQPTDVNALNKKAEIVRLARGVKIGRTSRASKSQRKR